MQHRYELAMILRSVEGSIPETITEWPIAATVSAGNVAQEKRKVFSDDIAKRPKHKARGERGP